MTPDSSPERAEGLETTLGSSDTFRARQRALFALFCNEADVTIEEDTLFRLVSAMLATGHAIRPIVTRF